MSVSVDVVSLLAAAEDSGGSEIVAQFTPSSVDFDPGRLRAELSVALRRANDASDEAATSVDDPSRVHANDPVVIGEGAVCMLTDTGVGSSLSTWAERVGRHLSDSGWHGVFAAQPKSRGSVSAPPGRASRSRTVTRRFATLVGTVTVLFTSGWTTRADTSRRVSRAGWKHDRALQVDVAHQAASWFEGDDLISLTINGTGGPVGRTMLTERFTAALGTPAGIVALSQRTPSRVSAVKCDPYGRVLLFRSESGEQDGDAAQGVHLSRHIDVVRSAAAWCDYAMTRHQLQSRLSLPDALDWRPALPFRSTSVPKRDEDPSDYYASWRHLDARTVPDAYGVQLLTDAHMANLDDGLSPETWAVERVSPGRHLVTARSLDLWFSGVGEIVSPGTGPGDSLVPASTLDAARRSFAPLLLRGPVRPPPLDN